MTSTLGPVLSVYDLQPLQNVMQAVAVELHVKPDTVKKWLYSERDTENVFAKSQVVARCFVKCGQVVEARERFAGLIRELEETPETVLTEELRHLVNLADAAETKAEILYEKDRCEKTFDDLQRAKAHWIALEQIYMKASEGGWDAVVLIVEASRNGQ